MPAVPGGLAAHVVRHRGPCARGAMIGKLALRLLLFFSFCFAPPLGAVRATGGLLGKGMSGP